MENYVRKSNFTESFLGLWLLPLQDRIPEALASWILAAEDRDHGNI